MKKDEQGKAHMGMSFTDDDLHYLTHVNNLLHSLFSICEACLNNQQVYNSNCFYGHMAFFPKNLTLQQKIIKIFWCAMVANLKKSLATLRKSLL